MSTPIVRRRKKAVEVDTLAWSGRETDLPAVRTFLGADLVGTEETGRKGEWSLLIRTMERGAEPDVIPPGWVLIRGVRGEHYACEPGVLADTYEDADTPLHAACRTEALTEGAALLEDRACDADWNRSADYCAGLRAGAELLLAKTTEKATAPTADAPEAGGESR